MRWTAAALADDAGAAGRIERDGCAAPDPRASRRATLRPARASTVIGLSRPRVQRIEADTIDELGRPLDVPDREIRPFAGFERPRLLGEAERARRIARDAGEAFVDRQAEQRRRHVERQQQRRQRRGAGIANRSRPPSGRPCWRKSATGGACARAGCNRRPAAARRRRRRAPSPRRRLRRYIRDDRPRARRTRPRAPRRRRSDSWSACSLTGRPSARAAAKTRATSSAMKAMRSQKASTASARPSAASAGIISSATRVDIGVAVVARIPAAAHARRESVVRTAIGRCSPSRRATRERLALGVEFEPVAGFDLDRGDAFGDQRVEPAQARREKFVLARRARRAHGRDDAAAGARDLLVARAGEPQLEFVGAIAAVDEMGVAVDQPGRDPAAFAIDDARLRRARRRAVRPPAPAKAMRPSRAATAPRSTMPRPGPSGASVARRAFSQIVSTSPWRPAGPWRFASASSVRFIV